MADPEEMNEIRAILKLHQSKLEESASQTITLAERLDNNEAQQDRRHAQLLESQECSIRAIKKLTQSTEGLVAAWTAANGAIKVGAALGKFVKWLAGFAVVGAMIALLKDNLPPS
jgi:hypothetical protein